MDLTPTQWETLELLWQRGEAGMNELADELRLSQSTLTRIVDLLEKKDLARRRPSRDDRRRVEATLTPRGEELYLQVRDRLEAACREILRSLPADQHPVACAMAQALGRATRRWVDRQRPAGPLFPPADDA